MDQERRKLIIALIGEDEEEEEDVGLAITSTVDCIATTAATSASTPMFLAKPAALLFHHDRL